MEEGADVINMSLGGGSFALMNILLQLAYEEVLLQWLLREIVVVVPFSILLAKRFCNRSIEVSPYNSLPDSHYFRIRYIRCLAEPVSPTSTIIAFPFALALASAVRELPSRITTAKSISRDLVWTLCRWFRRALDIILRTRVVPAWPLLMLLERLPGSGPHAMTIACTLKWRVAF
jgi:hypothetical protein